MTKIYLDSGDPHETKQILSALGSLDGQTTNPSLIVKNPEVQKCKTGERVCSEEDLLGYYKDIVTDIRSLLDAGESISVEVYADEHTSADDMIEQGTLMNEWIPDAHVKLPITAAGLEAAHHFVKKGINVNMTLCFSLEQAMAVHSATKGCEQGQVYISPFIGRLDDIGESGIQLIADILSVYRSIDSNVEVLSASIRNNQHVQDTLALGCDRITIPFNILKELSSDKLTAMHNADAPDVSSSSVGSFAEKEDWTLYNITHPLTDKGLAKFAQDWKSIFTA